MGYLAYPRAGLRASSIGLCAYGGRRPVFREACSRLETATQGGRNSSFSMWLLEVLQNSDHAVGMVESAPKPEQASLPTGQSGRIFVGRQREMGELVSALNDETSGRGRLSTVVTGRCSRPGRSESFVSETNDADFAKSWYACSVATEPLLSTVSKVDYFRDGGWILAL